MMYKEYVTLFFQSIKNKNLPTSVKIIIGVIIAYFFLPFDIIPDIGLPVGLVDDVILGAILIGVGGKIIYNQIQAKRSGQAPADDNVIDI